MCFLNRFRSSPPPHPPCPPPPLTPFVPPSHTQSAPLPLIKSSHPSLEGRFAAVGKLEKSIQGLREMRQTYRGCRGGRCNGELLGQNLHTSKKFMLEWLKKDVWFKRFKYCIKYIRCFNRLCFMQGYFDLTFADTCIKNKSTCTKTTRKFFSHERMLITHCFYQEQRAREENKKKYNGNRG